MAILKIELSKNGVDRVQAGAHTAADGVEIGELVKASALPIRQLDDAVRPYFDARSAQGEGSEIKPAAGAKP